MSKKMKRYEVDLKVREVEMANGIESTSTWLQTIQFFRVAQCSSLLEIEVECELHGLIERKN